MLVPTARQCVVVVVAVAYNTQPANVNVLVCVH